MSCSRRRTSSRSGSCAAPSGMRCAPRARTAGRRASTPTSRARDVTREVDLIEEVSRFKLPEIPFTLPRREAMFGRLTRPQRLRRSVEDALVGAGYAEAYTSTFVAEGDLHLPEPLSAEAAAIRTVLYASLLEPVRRNADAGADDVALFEVARVYRDAGADLPEERWH